MPFPRVLPQCEMQTASFRVWTPVTVPISNDNNYHLQYIYIYISVPVDNYFSKDNDIFSLSVVQGSLNKFPDFFRMDTFIDSTHMKLLFPFEVISSGCNALVVPFQQRLEGPIEVLLCERVNDLCHSFFHLLNCFITTASKFFLALRE